jgi:hypothetical protein
MGRNLEPHGPRQRQVGVHAMALRCPALPCPTNRLHRDWYSHTGTPATRHSGSGKEDTAPPKQPLASLRFRFRTYEAGLLNNN